MTAYPLQGCGGAGVYAADIEREAGYTLDGSHCKILNNLNRQSDWNLSCIKIQGAVLMRGLLLQWDMNYDPERPYKIVDPQVWRLKTLHNGLEIHQLCFKQECVLVWLVNTWNAMFEFQTVQYIMINTQLRDWCIYSVF